MTGLVNAHFDLIADTRDGRNFHCTPHALQEYLPQRKCVGDATMCQSAALTFIFLLKTCGSQATGSSAGNFA